MTVTITKTVRFKAALNPNATTHAESVHLGEDAWCDMVDSDGVYIEDCEGDRVCLTADEALCLMHELGRWFDARAEAES